MAQFGVAGQFLYREAGLRDSVAQLLEVNLTDFCQGPRGVFTDLFQLGRNRRDFRVRSGTGYEVEFRRCFWMKAEVDIQNTGQQALHTELSPQALLDQFVKFGSVGG